MFLTKTRTNKYLSKVSLSNGKYLIRLCIPALLTLCSCVAGTPKDHTGDILTLESRIRQTNEKLEELRDRVSVMQYMLDRHERTLVNLDKHPPQPGKTAPLSSETVKSREAVAPLPDAAGGTPSATPRKPAPRPLTAKKKSAVKKAPTSPDKAYKLARKVFTGGDFKGAARRFESFAREYPGHRLANNALYWKGECYYARKQYKEAVACFDRLIAEYPEGSKAPDALLKSAYAYIGLDKVEKARTILKKVIKQHPFSPAGQKAEKMLTRLNAR